MIEDKTLEKLLAIEKAINEIATLRQGLLELKEAETQRQKAMEAMRASEEKYRTLLDNLPPKIFMKDTNSVYILCNQSYAADLKIEPGEICGRTDYEFFPGEMAKKYASDEKRIMSAGQSEDTEENYVHAGQTFLVRMIRNPVTDERGGILGILGIFWDITEQKREEEKFRRELQESASRRAAELQRLNERLQQEITEGQHIKHQLKEAEQRYQALLENNGTALAVIGEDLIISSANREFEKLSGYSKDEVEGKKRLNEFILPDGSGEIDMTYPGGNTDPVPRYFEARFMGPKGDIKDLRITMAELPEVNKAVVSLMDITDSKRTEESLRNLEEKCEALMENSEEAILLIHGGLLKEGNGRISKISGYSREELTSRPFKEFIHPDDQDRFELHLQKIENRELPPAQCFKLIHKDGCILHWEARGTFLHWEGSPSALIFMRDITEGKRTEEELWNSIKPFRSLVNAVEKTLLARNGRWPEQGMT